MESSQGNDQFRTTSWTLVRQASDDPAALTRFCERYLAPSYAYFRRLGCSRDRAEDLTQGFFATHIASGRLLAQAREERGQLRSLLKSALRNWRIDAIRSEHGRAGGRAREHVTLDGDTLASVDAAVEALTPEAAFDRTWAIASLEEALRRAEAECASHGQADYWSAFERRWLFPLRLGQQPLPLETVGQEFGLSGRETANRLDTVRRRIRRHLERVIAEGQADTDDALTVEDLRLVVELLARSGV